MFSETGDAYATLIPFRQTSIEIMHSMSLKRLTVTWAVSIGDMPLVPSDRNHLHYNEMLENKQGDTV